MTQSRRHRPHWAPWTIHGNMRVVEGLIPFGPQDSDYLHDPTHPNDAGNQRMADRLAPIVEEILFGKDSGKAR